MDAASSMERNLSGPKLTYVGVAGEHHMPCQSLVFAGLNIEVPYGVRFWDLTPLTKHPLLSEQGAEMFWKLLHIHRRQPLEAVAIPVGGILAPVTAYIPLPGPKLGKG